tara:strand:+ start:640 stop:1143 length:504 start_codon:yes stop_codon:yes gene_type:complete
MENKINRKIETYITNLRNTLQEKIDDLDIDKQVRTQLTNIIYNCELLQLSKDDFMKRKRVVSVVSLNERCTAKKASGEQCTRKKKSTCNFCGTHEKCQPHGIVELNNNTIALKKREISIQDIKGIHYYIDNEYNVYNTADILSNVNDPRIIAKYREINGEYSIVLKD